MRKLLALVFLLPALAFAQYTVPQHTGATATSGGGSTVTLVQHAIKCDNGTCPTSVTSVALAYPSTVTSGNILVVGGFADGHGQTVSLSDTLTSSWTRCSFTDDAGGAGEMGFWWAIAPSSGADTVTLAWSGASQEFNGLQIAEYSGEKSAAPIDSCPAPVFTTSGATLSISLGTTTNNGRVFSFAIDENALVVGGGYTLLDRDDALSEIGEDKAATGGATTATVTGANSGGIGGLAIAPGP